MRFLFDTDHISILQRHAAPNRSLIKSRMAAFSDEDFAYSIVSFDEQMRGVLKYVKSARKPAEIVRGYRLLEIVLEDYIKMPVLPFDDVAAVVFATLPTSCKNVGTMDLRIASIALSRGLTLLTRNKRDFSRVPNLIIDDWTI